jgi:anti-anti-sigma factor
MLKIHPKRLDAVEILSLEGRIVTGETEILRTAVQSVSGVSEIVLDFSKVTMVDARGLGVLLQLREQSLARGIHLELTNLNRSLYRIFEITRLDTVFNIRRRVEFLPEYVYMERVPLAA